MAQAKMIRAKSLRAWRLCSARFADTAFSGMGAKLYGGRWNQAGWSVVYTSGSLALASLEYFVHLDPDLIPADLMAIPADIPATVRITRLTSKRLPANWRDLPAPDDLRLIGTKWLKRSMAAVLAVPSVIVPHESNYLLNPSHKDFRRIKIGKAIPFSFDPRMWKASDDESPPANTKQK